MLAIEEVEEVVGSSGRLQGRGGVVGAGSWELGACGVS